MGFDDGPAAQAAKGRWSLSWDHDQQAKQPTLLIRKPLLNAQTEQEHSSEQCVSCGDFTTARHMSRVARTGSQKKKKI
jgi:hypothetical protein